MILLVSISIVLPPYHFNYNICTFNFNNLMLSPIYDIITSILLKGPLVPYFHLTLKLVQYTNGMSSSLSAQ